MQFGQRFAVVVALVLVGIVVVWWRLSGQPPQRVQYDVNDGQKATSTIRLATSPENEPEPVLSPTSPVFRCRKGELLSVVGEIDTSQYDQFIPPLICHIVSFRGNEQSDANSGLCEAQKKSSTNSYRIALKAPAQSGEYMISIRDLTRSIADGKLIVE